MEENLNLSVALGPVIRLLYAVARENRSVNQHYYYGIFLKHRDTKSGTEYTKNHSQDSS